MCTVLGCVFRDCVLIFVFVVFLYLYSLCYCIDVRCELCVTILSKFVFFYGGVVFVLRIGFDF